MSDVKKFCSQCQQYRSTDNGMHYETRKIKRWRCNICAARTLKPTKNLDSSNENRND